jgi:hypothetical protein
MKRALLALVFAVAAALSFSGCATDREDHDNWVRERDQRMMHDDDNELEHYSHSVE